MHALVYHGPGQKSWDEVPDPKIEDDTDAIVRIDSVTICGTDLHILKGDVPEMTPGRILGHEAVGTIQEVGMSVRTVKPGDRVLLSCISACGRCRFCRVGQFGQCRGGGGWIFGHLIDGVQAEYARVPFADTSTYKVPRGAHGRAGAVPLGHPADGLRGGGPERQGPARGHRGRRGRRSGRPVLHPGGQAVLAGPRGGDRSHARPS